MRNKGQLGNLVKDHHFHIVDQLLGNYDISLIGLYKSVGKF